MAELFPLKREFDECGRLIFHPDCFDCNVPDVNVGLGPGSRFVIEVEPFVDGNPIAGAELWVFVQGHEGHKLGVLPESGAKQVFTVNWDFRKSIEIGTVKLAIFFPSIRKWKFSGDPATDIEFLDLQINITIDKPNPPGLQVPPEIAALVGDFDCGEVGTKYAILVYDCTCEDCTRPYDNDVFCLDCYNETPFALQARNRPGFDKQVFITEQMIVKPLRGVALTRSADAFNENLQLLYQSQKWVMVWDLEMNRLIDFFPQEWLRFGASMYFQQQTLRKNIDVCSSRRPYYIEVVDLGLVNNPQGSFNLDKDRWGQRTTNWDVPSRLMALSYNKLQRPAFGHGTPSGGVTEEQLYVEFNHVSVDRFSQISEDAVIAQRERFFADREMFLDQTARQRHHDQIMFMARETIERFLRLGTDTVENLKLIVDSFNPDAEGSFGFFLIVLINSISNKILKTKNDFTGGNFKGTGLEPGEESLGDWNRYIYGELRRLVELTKIEKKDVQLGLLKALTGANLAENPNAVLEAFSEIGFEAIEEQFELASSGKIPAGAGLVDPDTIEEDRDRGLKTG